MKEAIEEITKATDTLMVLARKFERGQVIDWDVIEKISGSRFENRGRHVINKWRRRMEREREVVTLCSDGVGVRLLTHKETASEIPQLRQRKAYRQVRRALKQVKTVDVSRLSDHERRLLAAQQVNMAEQRRSLFRSRKQAATGVVATEGNPRRAIA